MLTTLDDVNAFLEQLPLKNKNHIARIETVKTALEVLGSPQNSCPAIHIAGTSGKGSTAYYAADMLRNAGHTVGLTVSPHVNFVSERAQVNGAILEEKIYCQHMNDFISVLEFRKLSLTYIEFLDVFAFWLFDRLSLDYIVVEVGLGGRLDPTNVLEREDTVRVITDIGLDHTEILGDTIEKIATEKAGIIHKGNHVVMNKQADAIMSVIQTTSTRVSAELHIVEQKDERSRSLPAFQQRNWTLALQAVATRLHLDNKHPLADTGVKETLNVTIPGRYERFLYKNIEVVIDVAHNPQKMQALADSFEITYAHKKAITVVAFGTNKETQMIDCLKSLQDVSSKLIITTFTGVDRFNKRAIQPEVICEVASKLGIDYILEPNSVEALKFAIKDAGIINAPVLVVGSFYLVDEVRTFLMGNSEELDK